jgi:Flp pilus assembly protein TadD
MNLAKLLERQARPEEAAPFVTRLAQLERDPPFAHFDRGVAAAKAGDFRTARDEIRLELKRDPDYHEFHFWLGVAHASLGEHELARRHVARALEYSTTRREHDLYAAKLERLDARR